MKTIAVVFAAALALAAAMPSAQAAQNGVGTQIKVQTAGAVHAGDELSSRHRGWHGHRGGYRHGWHGHRRGWYGHRHWRGHRHCWHTWRHGRRIVVCR